MSDARESRLIDIIYDAALRPENWRVFLEEYCALLGATSGLIHAPPVRSGRSVPFVVYNLDFSRVEDKWRTLGQEAPFATRAIERGVAPGVFANFDLIPPEEILPTEYYRHYMAPLNIGDVIQMIVSLPDADNDVGLGILASRPLSQGRFTARETDIAWRLFPHVRRAATLALHVGPRQAIDRAMAQALDAFATPCMLFDAQKAPVFINQAARTLLENNEAFRPRGASYAPADPRAERQFDEALSNMVKLSSPVLPRAGVEIVIPQGGGKHPLLAVIKPLGAENPFSEEVGPARAAVYLLSIDRRPPAAAGARRAQSLFNLTAAETEVFHRLVAGESVAEIARARRVSIETVRAQVKAILVKTHSHRQSDLQRLSALADAPYAGLDPAEAPVAPARSEPDPEG